MEAGREQQRKKRAVVCLADRGVKVKAAGEKEGGSMLVVLNQRGARFFQVALGRGIVVPGSHAKQLHQEHLP